MVVADDPQERFRPDCGDRRLDGRVGRRQRATSAADGKLVDEHRIGDRSGSEPEGIGTAAGAVSVTVEGRARSVKHGCADRGCWGKAQASLVCPIRAAVVARIRHLGIEGRVAGVGDSEKVGAAAERQADEGVASVVIIVTGDKGSHGLTVHDFLLVERQDAVELAGDLLAGPGDHGLRGKRACLR